MINWMQHNKKYLIITVWISSIAFIAATMVGWGAYSFTQSSSTVAKVGKIKISVSELELEYQNAIAKYSQQYQEIFGKQPDMNKTDSDNFKDQALTLLINRALIENFANDNGIRITDQDVANELYKYKEFQRDGKFDKQAYKLFLERNRLKASEFEGLIKKDLIIKSVLDIFPNVLTPLEKDVLSIPNRLQNRVSIEIISNIKPTISNDDLKKYYEDNKEQYKSEKEFKVESLVVNVEDLDVSDELLQEYYNANKASYVIDGSPSGFDEVKDKLKKDFQEREAKKKALKQYNDFVNGKASGIIKNIKENSVSSEMLNILQRSKENDVIKPIFNEEINAFEIIRLINKFPEKIMEFESVKEKVKEDYNTVATENAIKRSAESRLNVFEGKDIGYINLDTDYISGINQLETKQLIKKIFLSDSKNGYLLLPNKAILYKITEQSMLNKDANDKEDKSEVFKGVKANLMEGAIIDFLTKEYKIKKYLTKDL